ncbi:MAG: HAD-IB family hydrolase [Piscirickettsiaceae bacterium]|nr:MAG: HAD-IB family hydrolase [Piscirickettsiaceae bacterium]
MSLAIFDLDNTLISDDSDHLWGQYLVEEQLVDSIEYGAMNTKFYEDYCKGQLDIDEYLNFALKFLADNPIEQLHAWRADFIQQKIRPLVLPAAIELVESHRKRDDTLIVITATNHFVTEPIVSLFNITNMLATDPELINNQYTGRYIGDPCYQQGKVSRLNEWLKENDLNLDDSSFYSDSHNDIPLLELVTHPYAVDPDKELRQYAIEKNWPIISLR